MPDGSTIGRFGSGREVRRIEDAGLLAGTGRFTDDFSLPGQTYLCLPALSTRACPDRLHRCHGGNGDAGRAWRS